MKILVTGGAGFIGTYLCRTLVKQGHEVHVLDLKAPSHAVTGVFYEQADVRNSDTLAKVIRGIEAVYHLAAIVSVPLCQEAPLESHRTNLLSTLQVLEAIRTESVKQKKPIRMIFSGSSVVYANSIELGEYAQEDSVVTWPLSFYGAQKLGSEHAIRLYCEHYQIPSIVFRFFNVYGPGQDPKSPYSGVISIFLSAIQQGKPLFLHGGGNQTRDFVSVHDVAHACALALTTPGELCTGQAINLGTGKSISIRQLAEVMTKVANKKVHFEITEARAGDVKYSQANVLRAKERLNWMPKITLEEGIRELLEPSMSHKERWGSDPLEAPPASL